MIRTYLLGICLILILNLSLTVGASSAATEADGKTEEFMDTLEEKASTTAPKTEPAVKTEQQPPSVSEDTGSGSGSASASDGSSR